MKNLLFPCLLLLLFSACVETRPTLAPNPNDSYLLHVECVRDEGVRRAVLMLMRQARARDITEDKFTMPTYIIEAAYYKDETMEEQVDMIADRIREIGMVSFVEVRNNPRVVRESH